MKIVDGMGIPWDGIDRRKRERLKYYTTSFGETQAALETYFSEYGQWVHGQVLVLFTQQLLKCHVDNGMDGIVRRHVVLQTNPDAWTYHDGDWQHLKRGGVYAVDPTLPHGAVNFGQTPRVHLFYDVNT